MDSNNVEKFFIGMAVGLVIGGVVALLYAPQPGEVTRAKITEKARDIKHKIKPTLDTITNK